MAVIEIATAFVAIRPQTDGFESELTAAVGGQEVEVPVVADTGDAEAAVGDLSGEDVEVGVEADTGDAEAAIGSIDAPPIEQEVTVDTSAAEAQIGGLGDQVSELIGGGGGGVGGATGALDAFSGAAIGAGGASSMAATGGLTALAAGLGYAVSEGSEAQVTLAQLDQMVTNMGANAGVTSGGLQALATDIQTTAGFSDEAVMSGEAMVLMFENVRNVAGAPIFDRTIQSAADLARSPAFNGDIAGAARTLGRAMDDPVSGMGRLRRAGIQLTEAQEATITALQESGDVVGAQAALLDIVDQKVGGLAESYGSTYAGGVDRAKEAIGEMSEALGAQMLPALEAVSLSVIDQIARLNSWDDALNGALLSGPIQAIMGLGDGIQGVGTLVGELPPGLRDAAGAASELGSAADDAGYAVSNLSDRIQGYLTGVFSVPEAERALRDSFASLAETLDDPARSADDVAVSLQGIVERAAALGSASGDMTGAVDAAVFGLAGLQNQGKLSAAEVAEVTSQLESIPGNTEGNVAAPGATTARSQAQAVGDALLGIPRYTYATVVVDAVTAGIDAAGRAIAGLRADAARGITVTTHTVKESSQLVGAVGAGLGRAPGGGAAPINVVHQTVLDGRVLTETVNELNYVGAIAEGYET